MKIRAFAAFLSLLTACSGAAELPSATFDSVDGALHFTVSDAPATPGVLFVSANASGGAGMVTITSTRYGSTCNTSVSGRADVTNNAITLHVQFAERTNVFCTADIRALTYRADVSGLTPGAYSVRVVHADAPDTVGNAVYSANVTVK